MYAVAEIKHSSFRLPPVAKERLRVMAEEDEAKLTPFLTRLINEEWRRRAKAGALPAPQTPPAPKKR